MKKLILFFIFFITSLTTFSQVVDVDRAGLALFIYDNLYGASSNPDNFPAANYPMPYPDLTSNSVWDKKIRNVCYLDWNDTRTPFAASSSVHFAPFDDITRYEALYAIMEAFDVSPTYSGTNTIRGVQDDNRFYGYVKKADADNYLNNLSWSTFNGENIINSYEVQVLLNNVIYYAGLPYQLNNNNNNMKAGEHEKMAKIVGKYLYKLLQDGDNGDFEKSFAQIKGEVKNEYL